MTGIIFLPVGRSSESASWDGQRGRRSFNHTRAPEQFGSPHDSPVRGGLLGSSISLGASAPSYGRSPHPGRKGNPMKPAPFSESLQNARGDLRRIGRLHHSSAKIQSDRPRQTRKGDGGSSTIGLHRSSAVAFLLPDRGMVPASVFPFSLLTAFQFARSFHIVGSFLTYCRYRAARARGDISS